MDLRANWVYWLERLYDLRRDKRGSHERPHKPALLLAIMELLDKQILSKNAISLTDELVRTFRRYFDAVKRHDDQPGIDNPFFHLAGDNFYQVFDRSTGKPIYVPGKATATPRMSVLRASVGRFEEAFWSLMADGNSRHQLREAIIARYFPEFREKIAALAAVGPTLKPEDVLREEPPLERDAAFRRTILEIYDYRCAACGIRVRLEDDSCLVEAAHLIPFIVSRNDKPDNGVALCPNHHWAMDRFLIAPCPTDEHRAGVWQVHTKLDDRIEGQKDLVALKGRLVIPPREEKFCPSNASLRWRAERLSTRY